MTINRTDLELALMVCVDHRFPVGTRAYDAADILADVRAISDAQLAKGADLMRRLMVDTAASAEAAIQTVRQTGAVQAIPEYEAVIKACVRAAKGE